MTVRAYVRVRPRILRLLERLGLLEHRVEIEGEPFEVRWEDLLAPAPDAIVVEGDPGRITVQLTGFNEAGLRSRVNKTVPGPDDF